jgi:hypothetical protein
MALKDFMRLSNKKLESELLWAGSFSPGIAGTAEGGLAELQPSLRD